MSSTTRTILILLLTLTLGGAFGYEVYLISKSEADVAEAIALVDKELGGDARIKKIEQIQSNYQEDILILDKVLINRADLVAMIEELERTGRDVGVIPSISSITNDSKSSTGTAPETVRVAIDTRGSWASTIIFIKLLESLPYKYNIDKMEVFFDNTEWRTSSTLKLTTYPNK